MGGRNKLAWTAVLGVGIAVAWGGMHPACAGPPAKSQVHRTARHAQRGRVAWHHHGHLYNGYPDFAWGPPWGSFSMFVAPPNLSVSFCAPALTFPWTRYAYTGMAYGVYDPHGIYYNGSTGQTEYYLPPVYMPAELAYGPTALQRFMGWPASLNRLPSTPSAARLAGTADAASIRDRIRKSNKASRDRAQRFIQFGDALFQRQRYHEAVQRYRSAIEAAPDVADAYYHQGYALAATNRLALAAKAFRIALELDAHVVDRFRLRDLYADNKIVIEAHLENLVTTALAQPANGDLITMVGLFLYDEGQVERGRKFLRKARELAGGTADFLRPLIDADTKMPAAPPAEEILAGVDT